MKNPLNRSGIYKIVNKITGDCYIGSAKEISERWRRHRKDLRKYKHHSIILQRAWNKYGEDNFELIVCEFCAVDKLADRENTYLSDLSPVYNICQFAYSQIGRKLSDAHKQKLKCYALANGVRPPKSTYIHKCKPVYMCDFVTGKEIQDFASLSEACRFVGRTCRSASSVRDCCNGKRQSLYGYRWKWKTITLPQPTDATALIS